MVVFFREFNEANNKTNIGIKSAQGLKPKKLTQDEIVPDPRCKFIKGDLVVQ